MAQKGNFILSRQLIAAVLLDQIDDLDRLDRRILRELRAELDGDTVIVNGAKLLPDGALRVDLTPTADPGDVSIPIAELNDAPDGVPEYDAVPAEEPPAQDDGEGRA